MNPLQTIPLSKPDISDVERSYVQKVLNSSRLAMGPMLEAFEQRMAALCQTQFAVAVNSGTSALHLIVRALGLGPGDEVITTPFSFVASSNCILYEGAEPKFIDIDPLTLALNPELLKGAMNKNTRAILAVDVFGHPAPWPYLKEFAENHNLMLIDDACEAPGAKVKGIPIGAWGHAAAFGFYPNKQITTGEGGCITTNNEELVNLCRSMRNQGRFETAKMEHVRLGYNYRMDELSAALGCAQLERFDIMREKRSQVAHFYNTYLGPLQDDILVPQEMPGHTRSWFVYVIQLKDHFDNTARDQALKLLKEAGIGCAPYFPSIHLQPYYRKKFGYKEGDFPVCEAISNRNIALPFFTSLTEEEIVQVSRTLTSILPQLPRKARTIFS